MVIKVGITRTRGRGSFSKPIPIRYTIQKGETTMKNKVTKKPIRKKKATTEKEKAIVPSPMTDPFIDSHMRKAEAEAESVPTESASLEVEEKPDQITPGGLIVAEEVSRYRTVDEKYQELQIGQIEHFLGLPDFVARSRSNFPLIIETSLSMVCIDGWDRIEEARAEGRTHIGCLVEQVLEYSEKELCLRKAAVRMVARGGRGTYGEHVRNVKILTRKLLESEEPLVSFRHGGDRRGLDFVSNNRGENVREVLAERLELSLSSINQMIAHAVFLDDHTIDFFAVQGVSKDFFEKAQRNKNLKAKDMKSRRASDREIEIEISKNARDWYEEYVRERNITEVTRAEETITENTVSEPVESPIAQDLVPAEVQQVFSPWPGNVAEAEEEDSLDKIKGDVEGSAERLLRAVTYIDPDEFKQAIAEEIKFLLKITQRLGALEAPSQEAGSK